MCTVVGGQESHQIRDHGAVGVHPVHRRHLGRVDPPHGGVFQRSRLGRSGRGASVVDAQHADVDRQVGADPAVRDDVRPQLLATLAHDGGGFVLARFHPTAGQLPPAGQLDGPGALGDEQPPVPDEGGGDHR